MRDNLEKARGILWGHVFGVILWAIILGITYWVLR